MSSGTVEWLHKLRDAGFSNEQAEAIVSLPEERLVTRDYLDVRLSALEERLNARLSALEVRLGALEDRFNAGLSSLEDRFNARLGALEDRFNARLADLKNELTWRMLGTAALIITAVGLLDKFVRP